MRSLAADAEPLHRRAEIGGARQHVRRGIRAVADLVDVEEARAGDVGGEIFVAAAAAARRHVPARIDDDEVGLAEMVGQPFGRDQRFHLREDRLTKGLRWRPHDDDDQAASRAGCERLQRRVRPAVHGRAQALPRRRAASAGKRIFPKGSRMVPGARPDAARGGPRRDPRPGPVSRRPARRTACASRCRPGSSPPPSLSQHLQGAGERPRHHAARATASSNIGRSRACCCSTAC